MSDQTQHILVLVVVALCVVYLLWQVVGTFVGRRSRAGSCCAKGCEPAPTPQKQGVHFMPVDMLSRKR